MHRPVACAVVAAVSVGSVASSALGQVEVYDPGLGTLPTAQGWVFSGDLTPATSVAGGVFQYGPTTVGGTTYWSASPSPAGMDFAAGTWSITADARLAGAGLNNFGGFRRGGFSLYLADAAGRWIIADMGDVGVTLRNDNNGTADPLFSIDMTEFRTVTLEAGPSGARLLVDGVQRLTLDFGAGAAPSEAWWGEGTILTNSRTTEVRSVVLVPGPGAGALAGAGLLLAARRRR